jgi:TetR/AcrR family transcriptional repressor of nem operon
MSPEMRSRLLNEAEVLIRTRGYAAFSYADLATSIGIRKASIHHYFPTKEALVTVLVEEYIARFVATLERLTREHANAGDRVRAYGQLFLDGFERGLLPLCGALSAELSALPDTLRPTVHDFFQLHLDWLEGLLIDGVRQGVFAPDTSPERAALLLLSTLEGGSFVGWALARQSPVLAAFETALHTLESHGTESAHPPTTRVHAP